MYVCIYVHYLYIANKMAFTNRFNTLYSHITFYLIIFNCPLFILNDQHFFPQINKKHCLICSFLKHKPHQLSESDITT